VTDWFKTFKCHFTALGSVDGFRVIEDSLKSDSVMLSWHPLPNALSYEVTITGEGGLRMTNKTSHNTTTIIFSGEVHTVSCIGQHPGLHYVC